MISHSVRSAARSCITMTQHYSPIDSAARGTHQGAELTRQMAVHVRHGTWIPSAHLRPYISDDGRKQDAPGRFPVRLPPTGGWAAAVCWAPFSVLRHCGGHRGGLPGKDSDRRRPRWLEPPWGWKPTFHRPCAPGSGCVTRMCDTWASGPTA